ncbi:MAG: TIGR04211 family SH3 domain-containing protein [Gammaproteobacteria bacterium]|nr:TIGR04211 family SH3 domain-containing protein [Gammaproteobacteria bacterium]
MTDMLKTTIITFCILSLNIIVPGTGHAGSTRYVTDELTIPLRSGTTNRHKILKFIPSGTRLKVLETSDDGKHIKTEFNGSEGWVKTDLVTTSPGAKEQLTKVQRRLDALTKNNAPMKQKIDQANKLLEELTEKNNELTQEKQDLLSTLTKLRDSAAHPIKVAEENEQLLKEIQAQKDKNQSLLKENALLKDKNIKEWFVIGAIVSLGSLVFGLVIPNISWRKKKSWGDL